jgi:hypothetical protein
MMKSIEIKGLFGETKRFATNHDGSGAFVLNGGCYNQIAGNAQTPTFKSPAQFRRWLRDRFGVRGGRIVSTWGWDQ